MRDEIKNYKNQVVYIKLPSKKLLYINLQQFIYHIIKEKRQISKKTLTKNLELSIKTKKYGKRN